MVSQKGQNRTENEVSVLIGQNPTNWKQRRRIYGSSSKYALVSLLCSFAFVAIFGIDFASAFNFPGEKRMTRVGSQSDFTSLLTPTSFDLKSHPYKTNLDGVDNRIDPIPIVTFPTEPDNKILFPMEKSRESRNLELEEGRKAAGPDVQDIIDGIVKLLGGKVHNPNTNGGGSKKGNQGGIPPTFPPNNNPHQPNPHHQNQNVHPTSQIPLNRPYNLFNPTKPIFYPKPSRINNRAPPPLGPTDKQSFEAIPLELLHQHKHNTSALRPPFPLTKIQPQGQRVTAAPPYQGGVQLPQQLVPNSPHHKPTNIHHSRPSSGQLYYQHPPRPMTSPNPPTTSLLVPTDRNRPIGSSHGGSSGPSLQAQDHTDSIEDDERDAEKLTNGLLLKGLKTPFGLTDSIGPPLIEPTIPDEELPSFVSVTPTITQTQASSSPTTTQEITTFPTILSASSSTLRARLSESTSVSSLIPSKASTFESTPIPTSRSVNESNFNLPSTETVRPPPKSPVFKNEKNNGSRGGIGTSTSLGTIPTPALRPGIVLPDEPPTNASKFPQANTQSGLGSVTTDDHQGNQGHRIGDVFDVTVTAQQNYGLGSTGQPFVIPVDISDEIITAPNGNQQFVSIDGKRTYFNLHSTSTSTMGLPSPTPPGRPTPNSAAPPKSHPGIVGPPTHPFASPSPPTRKKRPITGIGSGTKSIGTSLKIAGGVRGDSVSPIGGSGGAKSPPNIVRRPLSRRPSLPPVRIDTCIVGDDSTCNEEQFESCRTENGVSSCVCRPGYARKRHREPCKATVALVLSIRLSKLGNKKLSYNPEYFDQSSEIYHTLQWETMQGLESVFNASPIQGGYIGAKFDGVGFDGRYAVVNSTLLIHEVPNVATSQVKRDIQRQLIDMITRHHNSLGKSDLTVEGPISAINAIADLNECDNEELYDCDPKANCVNTYGSFECRCAAGYGDAFENDKRRSGRHCESCNSKTHCNGRGECLIENGQNTCRCSGNYYGSHCDIDGEVLAVAIGASISAILIIGLTLACLCMWSRRWKREEQKAALMSQTLFGGMTSQGMSYLGKTPYQQHLTLDERLRWAQVDPSLPSGNIYVSEPLSLHGQGSHLEPSPQIMASARRSADTCESTIEDFYDESRHQNPNPKRPKSRSSMLHGGHYCDLEGEPQSEIYAVRGPPFLPPFPAQFCVPTSPMNPYPHTRGFYS